LVGAAWGVSLKKYPKMVKQKDHWGCEVDIAVIATQFNRICQTGT
jgi:hypothetical protein